MIIISKMSKRTSKRLSKEEFIRTELEKAPNNCNEEDIDIKEKEESRIEEVLQPSDSDEEYIPDPKEKTEISESEISDSENENEIPIKSDWRARVKRKNESINPVPRKMSRNSESLNNHTFGNLSRNETPENISGAQEESNDIPNISDEIPDISDCEIIVNNEEITPSARM